MPPDGGGLESVPPGRPNGRPLKLVGRVENELRGLLRVARPQHGETEHDGHGDQRTLER